MLRTHEKHFAVLQKLVDIGFVFICWIVAVFVRLSYLKGQPVDLVTLKMSIPLAFFTYYFFNSRVNFRFYAEVLSIEIYKWDFHKRLRHKAAPNIQPKDKKKKYESGFHLTSWISSINARFSNVLSDNRSCSNYHVIANLDRHDGSI